jgi:hypothetical protein
MTSHVKLNPHLVYRDRTSLRTKEYQSEKDPHGWVPYIMGILGLVNIALCFCFVSVILAKGFQADTYYKDVTLVYHSSVLTQSNDTMPGNPYMPPTDMSAFANLLMNGQGVPYQIPHENTTTTDKFFHYMPRVWLYMKSTSTLSLTSVHSQFLVFVALWISAAFGVCSARYEKGTMAWQVPIARLVLVHIWNMIGLVLVVKLFGYPASWGEIPLSNFFIAVAAILVSWAYQYSYMIEIDSKNTKENGKEGIVVPVIDEHFSFFKRIMYLEVAVVAPLFMVATILPASDGIEQWRLQTVLFAIYVFFSITGLIERWIRLTEDSNSDVAYQTDGKSGENITHMRNAQTYLVYAAVMCCAAIWNAMMRETITDVPFYTTWTGLTRHAIWTMYAFMCLVLLSYLIQTVWHLMRKTNGQKYVWESQFYFAEILYVFWIAVKTMFFIANLYPDYITIVTSPY